MRTRGSRRRWSGSCLGRVSSPTPPLVLHVTETLSAAWLARGLELLLAWERDMLGPRLL